MKIVIADDEFIARKAIIQMVMDYNQSFHIIEAEDGLSALEAVKEHKPDLLLTDIRMPGMDGIKLAAYIHQHCQGTAVCIISGYDDFSYAQEAIRYKVEHYLLKPIGRQELYPVLEQIQRQHLRSCELEQGDALLACLYKNSEPSSFISLFPNAIARFQTAIIRMKPNGQESLLDTIKDMLNRRAIASLILEDNRYEGLFVLWLYYSSSEAKSGENLHYICDTYIKPFALQQGIIVSGIGISPVHSQIDKLQLSFKEAKAAALQSMIGNGVTIMSDHLGNSYPYETSLIHEWTESFNRKLSNLQAPEASDMIRQWLGAFRIHNYSAYMLQDWYATIVKIMNACIERLYPEPHHAFLEQLELLHYDSIPSLEQDLIAKLHALIEQMKAAAAKTDMIESIKEYVDVHYKNRILLDDLANQRFFVDPSYLSRLFKRKSGMSFTSHLLHVRMSKAKEILEKGTEMSVAEVASEVGFNDYSYFIQMYKKVFGETPGKYRSNRSQS